MALTTITSVKRIATFSTMTGSNVNNSCTICGKQEASDNILLAFGIGRTTAPSTSLKLKTNK